MTARGIVLSLLSTWSLFLLGMYVGASTVSTVSLSPLRLQGGSAFWQILGVNIPTAFIITGISLLTLGLGGIIIIVANSMTTGGLVHAALLAHWQPWTIVLALIPHGLIEISSFALFLGLGTFWSYHAFLHWFFHLPWPTHAMARRSLRQLLVACFMLVLAAMVEGFLTPILLIHS